MFFFLSADFFLKLTFSKILLGRPSECQVVWNQIRANVLLGLIWVLTVCNDYQLMTKFYVGRQRVNHSRKGAEQTDCLCCCILNLL